MPLNQSTQEDRPESRVIEDVRRELMGLRTRLIGEAARFRLRLDAVHPHYRESARNLLHYLVLRRRDRRPLQTRLATLGLSSLGRAESHVLATIDAVLKALHGLGGKRWRPPASEEPRVDFAAGEQILAEHTKHLFGPAASGRDVRIMVTMPSEAAEEYSLVHRLLEQGMDCMRINCAHDDAGAWLRMIEHLRRAELALGKSCRVVMDLAGPKLRTGPIEPRPAVIRIHPQRDVYGRVITPARVWLFAASAPQPPPAPAQASLPVPAQWLARLREGQDVNFTDARENHRSLTIVAVTDRGCWGEATKTAYLVPGTVLRCEGESKTGETEPDIDSALIADLPTDEGTLLLLQGDRLILSRDSGPGHPTIYDSNGQLLSPARIGVTIPEVFADVRPGETIWFDDGKIGGVIDRVEEHQVLVRITHTRVRGDKLRGDKGINLPESNLGLAALTAKDLEDLTFVARHADIVELSFANTARDVALLQEHLARLGSRQPAIVLKIETRRGFENLPDMLLTAMRAPCCGVMIARGDLAVECGFERLAEVQEEILWICEAAHVPVIWATQVLESLAKEGLPSRAEITDAAMGDRAECVMLNKGPYVVTAVQMLDGILRRMQTHQAKKRSMLRELHLAHALPPDRSGT